MISTLHKVSSHLPYSMVISKFIIILVKIVLERKMILISSRNIMSASYAQNLTFSIHEHLPSPLHLFLFNHLLFLASLNHY